ncbi:hypothetical protein [Xanthobacter autotrophicus]|uniref:hypothetical protein n=1 Tax=Xanthobacter autotrophicus TaxID=280 RepID=UPI00372809B5
MTRIAIDRDADGAYAVITRPGAPAERVELTHQAVGRLVAAAMEAWLVEERVRGRIGAGYHSPEAGKMVGEADPPHFIGALGE